MTGVTLSTKEISDAAHEFEAASKASIEIVEKLEKVTEELKQAWTGEAQEAFYKHHDDWQMLMKGQAALLTSISMELRALAERYEKADK